MIVLISYYWHPIVDEPVYLAEILRDEYRWTAYWSSNRYQRMYLGGFNY